MSNTAEECVKLQKHLALLRDEYVKLQSQLLDSERKFASLAASVGCEDAHLADQGFVGKLLQRISDLFEKDLYSDITIHLNGHQVRAHRFVLSVRSDQWGVPDLATADRLDFSDMPYNIGINLLKWVYTDKIDPKLDGDILLDLLKAAGRFNLVDLIKRCETTLIGGLDAQNCIRLFQTADALNLDKLRDHCSHVMTSRWSDFNDKDFESIAAPLLYKILKTRSKYPLHEAVKLKREDVVFLCLVEFDRQLSEKIDEWNERGQTPLAIALHERHASIAKTLLSHKADLDRLQGDEKSLLIDAVESKNDFAASFLIENHANVNVVEKRTGCNALLTIASLAPCQINEQMTRVFAKLLDNDIDVNAVDNEKNSVLHVCLRNGHESLLRILLGHKNRGLIDFNAKNDLNFTPLLYSLSLNGPDFKMAQLLLENGADIDLIDTVTGDSYLHRCIGWSFEKSAEFLLLNGIRTDVLNKKGESALHSACAFGLSGLVKKLLINGVDPNLTTDYGQEPDRLTALHVAVAQNRLDILKILLDESNYPDSAQSINVDAQNSQDETPLSLALWQNAFDMAGELVRKSANVNWTDGLNQNLLYKAICKNNELAALFLIQHGAGVNLTTPDGEPLLLLAISQQMEKTVALMCQKNCRLNDAESIDRCPLWLALSLGSWSIAKILAQYGADVNFWHPDDSAEFSQTLLHKAIDENNERVACYLIESGCDVNVLRKPIGSAKGDGQTALHMAVGWGLEEVTQRLVDSGAEVNAQDNEGQTAVHLAVSNQHMRILDSLLRWPSVDLTLKNDKGATPFCVAMLLKCNKAADAIRKRDPNTILQTDNKGYNFLHTAIINCDLEAVLFLLSIQMDVCKPTNDHEALSPLHLAVETGDEMILRNLLLAGADVKAITRHTKQTALHWATANDKAKACQILLEHKIDFNALDSGLNNALHIACQRSSFGCVKTLLIESSIDAVAVNLKGQTPLHLLALHGKDNSAVIFNQFLECMPGYPIDLPDPDGNTIFLLSYMNGNLSLCKACLAAGACLATVNRFGVSIFNHPTPTKQLLFRILDHLTKEPKWADGDFCSECTTKFTLTHRKHHCRHCGRLLCAKCSEKMMPVLKYDLSKAVRVCDACFDVLTLGNQA